ncbi:DUF4230 domain-containing protein [Brucepastera parasyntrophica]|uniref:DUF4230 domain-containing protein n=1 Tax=Brucepastera parasyntrophica TaxID=2880008 RepID=UPI00210B78E8|nr:DUF4230 domain-containing protein [Brucepastera parasyntrophica]ULQ60694.1 DUF4230 domain-containing protein [Brucepastera parasyntrophica]
MFFNSAFWLVILIIVLLGAGFILGRQFTKTRERKNTNISGRIREILPASEYACLVYHYSSVVQDSNSRSIINWNIPFTEKKIIFVIDGTIKLGLNGKDIAIKTDYNVIKIMLPQIRILSHELYPETLQVYNEKSGIFNRYKAKEHFELQAENKNVMADKLLANDDIFAQAREIAEQQFRSFLENLPGIRDVYSIIFQWKQDFLPEPALNSDQ